MAPDACRACEAPVIFARNTDTGAWILLDAEPNPDAGTIAVVRAPGRRRRLSATELTDAALAERRAMGMKLYTSHHATCPASASYRRVVSSERHR